MPVLFPCSLGKAVLVTSRFGVSQGCDVPNVTLLIASIGEDRKRAILIIYVHEDCGQPAVEIPDDFPPERPTVFPFPCLYCLQEIEDGSDLMVTEQMGQ